MPYTLYCATKIDRDPFEPLKSPQKQKSQKSMEQLLTYSGRDWAVLKTQDKMGRSWYAQVGYPCNCARCYSNIMAHSMWNFAVYQLAKSLWIANKTLSIPNCVLCVWHCKTFTPSEGSEIKYYLPQIHISQMAHLFTVVWLEQQAQWRKRSMCVCTNRGVSEIAE